MANCLFSQMLILIDQDVKNMSGAAAVWFKTLDGGYIWIQKMPFTFRPKSFYISDLINIYQGKTC